MSNEKNDCIHHWIIDSRNIGRCIKCPAVKDFGALLEPRERRAVNREKSRRGGKKYKKKGE